MTDLPSGVNADGRLVVRKYGTVIPVSRQSLLDHGLVKPTAEEKRQAEEAHRKYETQRAAATAAWPVFVAALAAVTDPVGRAVLNVHWNEGGCCRGCEFDGYEAEPPAWPCATTTTVAAALGISVPPDLSMAEQARM